MMTMYEVAGDIFKGHAQAQPTTTTHKVSQYQYKQTNLRQEKKKGTKGEGCQQKEKNGREIVVEGEPKG
jgi:hypothetical protein